MIEVMVAKTMTIFGFVSRKYVFTNNTLFMSMWPPVQGVSGGSKLTAARQRTLVDQILQIAGGGCA
ncbi:hypothetical protein ACFOLL_13860 [Falsochrobactrum ovis]|uniref:Uncharacterized protein n=1 Tax=Falsochrobactrum ovis TaxID=1293442 RepID=A0A364JRZ9_9HYPH|nr:hypothetical protein C7374_12137 [Falsochrobactrum ovis]